MNSNLIKTIKLHNFLHKLSFITFIGMLSACASLKVSTLEQDPKLAGLISCERLYQTHDKRVKQEDVTDAQTQKIKGFPFLRINRFFESFKDELNTEQKFEFWLSELSQLDLQARLFEWKNLSDASRNEIREKHLKTRSFEQRITACSLVFQQNFSKESKSRLLKKAVVKDSYSTAMRVFGIYPLTSLIVTHQIKKHQKTEKEEFQSPLNALQEKGQLTRYVPNHSQLVFNNAVAQENELGIPFITTTVLNDLFARHAPIIEVDQVANYDKIGEVMLDNKGSPNINTQQPVVYYMPSYTRFNGKILLQLNYFFWFSERPFQSKFDIYAGRFDGIIWRVTLNENLQPMIYDSVHNCGCYHKFYTTENIKYNESAATKLREPPFLAQSQLKIHTETPIVLRINSYQHFIKRVYQDKTFDKDAIDYHFKSYHHLRSLAGNNIRKSFFASNGIVKESARLERWILWPMGVASAGAMRQWGNHAVAFVGRRHFDEPYLFEKYFLDIK